MELSFTLELSKKTGCADFSVNNRPTMKLRIILCSCLLFSILHLDINCQQLQSWSAIYENGYVFNPALTAKWGFTEVSLSHRQDWSGFDNAPRTQFVGFQSPIAKDSTNLSIGGYILQDKVGPYRTIQAAGIVSYQIKPQLFSKESDVLAFGVKVGAKRNSFLPDNVTAYDGTDEDPLIVGGTSNGLHPSVDVGLYYSSISTVDSISATLPSHFYFGLAVRELLLQNNVSLPFGIAKSVPHFNLHGGYRHVPLEKTYFFEHTLFIDYALSKAWLASYNFRFEQMNKYWLSAGGASNGEVFWQAGVIVNRLSPLGWLVKDGALRIGAKGNYYLGQLGNYSGVGFEVYLAYQF
jgi:type IX secretion system PorP/SprF family membrane protein